MPDKHPLEYLSEAQDLMDLNVFMADDDFEQALELCLKCIADPHISIASARLALLRMQAYAFKFKMQGQVYMTIRKGSAGTTENQRKNVYYSISEQCHELAQTLKYICKETV